MDRACSVFPGHISAHIHHHQRLFHACKLWTTTGRLRSRCPRVYRREIKSLLVVVSALISIFPMKNGHSNHNLNARKETKNGITPSFFIRFLFTFAQHSNCHLNASHDYNLKPRLPHNVFPSPRLRL